jgi:hypothetical protein
MRANVVVVSVTPSSEEVALAEPGLTDLWKRIKRFRVLYVATSRCSAK